MEYLQITNSVLLYSSLDHYIADEAVYKSDSVFRLISKSWDDASPGERGVLLYKGDTVCAKLYNGTFNDYSATAICREMGYKQAADWTTGYLLNRIHQAMFSMTLSEVKCDNEDWKSCSYSTSVPFTCNHDMAVLLTCTGHCSNTSTILSIILIIQ